MNVLRAPLSSLLAAVPLVCTVLLPDVASGTVRLPITIAPRGGGQVAWMTTSPPASGVLEKSGKVTVDEGSYVDLTFTPNEGYELLAVLLNGKDFTFALDGDNHYQFGPFYETEKIVAAFSLIVPTGSFEFPFPVDNAALTAIAFLTGNYTGTVPGPYTERAYDLDVAMDEAGKLAIMATVDGVEPEPGGDPLGGSGRVKTVNGAPMMKIKMSFEGTLDGMPGKVRAKGEGPVEVQDLAGTPGLAGMHSYNAKLGGVPFKNRNVPVQATLDPDAVDNVATDWTLLLDLSEKVNPRNGKPFIAANAQLVLPNGDTIVFPEKKARYSTAKGYTLSFSRGTNVTTMPPTAARKAKIKIKRMTLVQVGPDWEPSGGTIDYRFLGQKGTADLLDFLGP
jgi:hypothetical protein